MDSRMTYGLYVSAALQPHPGPPPEPRTCRAGAITCWDLALLLTYIALVGGKLVFMCRLVLLLSVAVGDL